MKPCNGSTTACSRCCGSPRFETASAPARVHVSLGSPIAGALYILPRERIHRVDVSGYRSRCFRSGAPALESLYGRCSEKASRPWRSRMPNEPLRSFASTQMDTPGRTAANVRPLSMSSAWGPPRQYRVPSPQPTLLLPPEHCLAGSCGTKLSPHCLGTAHSPGRAPPAIEPREEKQ